MASADRKPSPISCENGVPITAHHGFSRNLRLGQQAAQSAPGCETWRRQPAQTGGNNICAGHRMAARASDLISGIGSATRLLR